MKTYLTDIIPKIQRFSKRLDDLTILTNQHWVVVDELMGSKSIYIFRSNNELLISLNGRVEKAKWEYLGNSSLLIDKKDESYLFKHGFLDENILALKVDSKDEYAFLVNENKYEGEINSFSNIIDFLTKKYIDKQRINPLSEKVSSSYEVKEVPRKFDPKTVRLKTNKGELEIITNLPSGYTKGDEARLNGKPAPDGRYSTGWPSWLDYLTVENGKIKSL
jgi:hypothetical protein